MNPHLLVDGFNLAFRAFHGMPDLTRSDGFPTGALHGWVRTLWMLGDGQKPDSLTVFFDSGESTRHSLLLAEYKATRAACPEPLQKQIPLLKKLTELLGFATVERPGVEADDLLAAQASHLAAAGQSVLIVSADKDFGQLVGASIQQLLPPSPAQPELGWRRLDAAGVEEKFGVPPGLIPDLLALTGDAVDNIPGLEGVGQKTAAKWLRQYRSLEGIIDHAAELKPARFQLQVHGQRETLRRNLRLTTLDLQHPPLEPRAPVPRLPELLQLLEEMEMKGSAREAARRYSNGLGDGNDCR